MVDTHEREQRVRYTPRSVVSCAVASRSFTGCVLYLADRLRQRKKKSKIVLDGYQRQRKRTGGRSFFFFIRVSDISIPECSAASPPVPTSHFIHRSLSVSSCTAGTITPTERTTVQPSWGAVAAEGKGRLRQLRHKSKVKRCKIDPRGG